MRIARWRPYGVRWKRCPWTRQRAPIPTDRPELQAMLSFVREGDVVCFEGISRLARNTRDFLDLMELFKDRKVDVVCLKEPIHTTTPAGKMIMTVFAAMYEMEWANIRQRQREGIDVARARGVRFGRPRVEAANFTKAYRRWRAGEIRAVDGMREVEMKRSTFKYAGHLIEHFQASPDACSRPQEMIVQMRDRKEACEDGK